MLECISWLYLQEVEIVLTAHPTQINRRTLQYKHIRIAVSPLHIFLDAFCYIMSNWIFPSSLGTVYCFMNPLPFSSYRVCTIIVSASFFIFFHICSNLCMHMISYGFWYLWTFSFTHDFTTQILVNIHKKKLLWFSPHRPMPFKFFYPWLYLQMGSLADQVSVAFLFTKLWGLFFIF